MEKLRDMEGEEKGDGHPHGRKPRVPKPGVDLSKIGGTKILGEKVVITDKFMGVSQLLGSRAQAAPPSIRLCLSISQST